MNTNKHGIPVIETAAKKHDDWTYTFEEVITDAMIEVARSFGADPFNRPKSLADLPPTASVNTRRNVPQIPTFKNARVLGRMSFSDAAALRLRLHFDGQIPTKSGKFLH